MSKMLPKTKPIIVTKYERLVKLDVAGNRALDCDHAEGFFTRGSDFIFEVFFDDEVSDDTYKGTRISEMYIKSGGCIQWSWGGPPLEKDPDWAFGKQLLADLLAGLEAAIQTQIANNAQYCIARFESAIYQLSVDTSLPARQS